MPVFQLVYFVFWLAVFAGVALGVGFLAGKTIRNSRHSSAAAGGISAAVWAAIWVALWFLGDQEGVGHDETALQTFMLMMIFYVLLPAPFILIGSVLFYRWRSPGHPVIRPSREAN